MLFSNQIGKGFTNYGNAFHFWRDHIRAKKKKQYTAQFPKSLQAMLKVNKTEGSNAKLNNWNPLIKPKKDNH